jgi:transposase
MRVYVGMDVHRKRSQVAIVDAADVPQRNRNLANDPAKLVPILGALPPGTPVAFEAAYGWGWLVELLEELQLGPHLSIPAAARRSPPPGCRNDKVDACTLAQLLRADLLPEAWIAPLQVRELRALRRHRASLVRMGTACKNRVHAVLADRGIPDHSILWTGPERAWLADLELPATPHAGSSRTAVGCWTPWPPRSPGWNARSQDGPSPTHGPGAAGLAWCRPADGHDLGRRDRRHRPVPHRPQAVRLGRADPRCATCDRKVRHGHITKRGSPWVRGILQQTAQTAKRHPSSPAPTLSWPAAAAATSPPPRSPGGCWPAASTSPPS